MINLPIGQNFHVYAFIFTPKIYQRIIITLTYYSKFNNIGTIMQQRRHK